jgi:hypothetical protein
LTNRRRREGSWNGRTGDGWSAAMSVIDTRESRGQRILPTLQPANIIRSA